MVRFRFEWTSWSTGPVTGCIIVASWALTAAIVGILMNVFQATASAAFTLSLAKALFATSVALLTFALATGVVLERVPSGRLRSPKVESPATSGPSGGFHR
ncbi:MAG: hypothetical protein DHS20C21_17920 [Gemmatimonadota bacterium]|nr:MAG: hypothetical protein DHS20C21_17920 [Gemmatimonadota bacterium]